MSNIVKAEPDAIDAEFMTEAIEVYRTQSSVLPYELPDDYYMSEEEEAEVADIYSRIRSIKMVGNEGRFIDSDDENNKFDELHGAFIGKLPPGQSWFPTQHQIDNEEWPNTYICRSWDEDTPPVLNPELPDKFRQIAEEAGAGKNCSTCPLRQFHGDEKPKCQIRYKTVIFAQELNEPAILYVPPTSKKRLDAFIGRITRRVKGRRPSLYSSAVKLETVKCHDEARGRSWHEVQPVLAGRMPRDAFKVMMETRADILGEIDDLKKRILENPRLADELVSPDLGEQPEPADFEGGLELNEDGELVEAGAGNATEPDADDLAALTGDDIPF